MVTASVAFFENFLLAAVIFALSYVLLDYHALYATSAAALHIRLHLACAICIKINFWAKKYGIEFDFFFSITLT